MFKLQSTSKYSPFDAIHLLRLFSIAQTVFELSVLMFFSVSAIFLFHLFHISKTFPSEYFFSSGGKKKVARGEIL